MKHVSLALSLLFLSVAGFAQDGVSAPQEIGTTHSIHLYKKKCTDGKCKDGGSGTLTFEYSKMKEYTGFFGEKESFAKGVLLFENGDRYEGTFKSFKAFEKAADLTVEYDSGTYAKAGAYTCTARFVRNSPTGAATVLYADGGSYKGNLKSGSFDGWGRREYSNGFVYEGEWTAGKRAGKGTFTDKTKPGYFFTGLLQNEYPNGPGKQVLATSPDTLEGSFVGGYKNGIFSVHRKGGALAWRFYKNDSVVYDGLAQISKDFYCLSGNCAAGKGKLIDADGNLYEGEMKGGKLTGTGTKTWANGTVYTGPFANNVPDGQGRMVFEDKTVYEGGFRNGQKEGLGKMTWANGSYYEGNWTADKMNGKGKYVWGNTEGRGDSYDGDFKDGARTGKGVYTYANGERFEGGWSAGNFAGEGTLTAADGTVYKSAGWNGRNFTAGTRTRNGLTENGTFNANAFLNEKEKEAADYTAKNPGVNGTIPVAKRMADIESGAVNRAGFFTHAVKTTALAKGHYSKIIEWGMVASHATGFKQYYIGPKSGVKKRPVPFGVRFTYEFVDAKGALIKRQSAQGHDLGVAFFPPEDGDYTIQVSYDFDGCSGCEILKAIEIDFELVSHEWSYRK